MMRAVVLLCMLGGVVAVDPRYTWNAPNAATADPMLDNVCLMDQSSCGCCLMQKQMWKMEEYFNMSLNELQNNLQKAQNKLNQVRASRSAFSVALTNDRWCLGPFRDERPVVYKYVFINLGDGYNLTSGVFTAPRSGVYYLALTVYSDSGAPGNSLDACASLRINGRQIAGPTDRNFQDQEDSGTIAVATQLQAGDQVSVVLPVGCFLCDNVSHLNTLTGFLLYSTD